MLNEALEFLSNDRNSPDWNRLGEDLPVAWITQALNATKASSVRRRRLPAEQVVWLMIALALYRHKSIGEVVDDLGLALPDEHTPFLCKSAVAQARQRLGAQPLAWLFQQSAQSWCEQDKSAYLFKGLQLMAMDGTTLHTHDTPALREHFGAQVYASGTVSSYPQVRGVTLTMLPTHLVRDALFGPYGTNEMTYAKQVIGQIPDDSLTVFDKGFLAAELLCKLRSQGQQRHFIIPAKANTKWEVIGGQAGDLDVRMRVSPQARKRCPDLPEFWEARAVTVIDQHARQRVLLTSLNERRRYKVADIAAVYEQRWRIETSYRELKHTLLGSALTLRSKTVAGVEQEIWGTLIAYNLLRLEIAKAALTVKCEPTEVSFIRAFHLLQFEIQWAATTRAYGKLPDILKHLRQRMISLLNEERPGRSCDRAVKAKPKRYTIRVIKKGLN